MSANNWTICPRCKINTDKKQRKNEKAMIDAYSKVALEDYEVLRSRVLKGIELEDTLREDYEQGMDKEGNYFLRYSCSCRVCDFNWEYKHDEKVKL